MAVLDDCKDCKIGRERGCEGCEQDLFNFDFRRDIGDVQLIVTYKYQEGDEKLFT